MPHSHHVPYRKLVKHIVNPLVDKGWNLHLKFGKGEPQWEQFVQGSSLWEPTTKTDKKEKVSKPQTSKQIPLEMYLSLYQVNDSNCNEQCVELTILIVTILTRS